MTTQSKSTYDDYHKQYLALKQRYDAINDGSVEDKSTYELDDEKECFSDFLHKAIREAPTQAEFNRIATIIENLQRLKIIDKGAELREEMYDYMFPNRHDEDFDEDDMSYDSVFGGD